MADLPLADPEIAAAEFASHLDAYWAARDLDGRGWKRTQLDPLTTIVTIPATDGQRTDDFWVRLGAEHYDLYPPTVMFVVPKDGWPRARAGTPWWPIIDELPWFKLHDEYGGAHGQVACFSMTAEYYVTDHSPTDDQRWKKGTHTVAATLSRLAEMLSAEHYHGYEGDRPT